MVDMEVSKGSGHPFSCLSCKCYFPSQAALTAHLEKSVAHTYCSRCDRLYPTGREKDDHIERSPRHNICTNKECHDLMQPGEFPDFETVEELAEHWKTSANHGYHSRHRQEHGSRDRFGTPTEMPSYPHYCQACNRSFVSAIALKSHVDTSSLHLQERNIKCFCGQKFVIPGIINHWELGHCKIRKAHLNKAISAFPEKSKLMDDSSRPTLHSEHTRRRSASPTSFDSYKRTFKCHSCRREYKSLPDLEQHLTSTAHDPHSFKCPDTRCNARFALLSSLYKHVVNQGNPDCRERIGSGTSCLARLWNFLEHELQISRLGGRASKGSYYRPSRRDGSAGRNQNIAGMQRVPSMTDGTSKSLEGQQADLIRAPPSKTIYLNLRPRGPSNDSQIRKEREALPAKEGPFVNNNIHHLQLEKVKVKEEERDENFEPTGSDEPYSFTACKRPKPRPVVNETAEAIKRNLRASTNLLRSEDNTQHFERPTRAMDRANLNVSPTGFDDYSRPLQASQSQPSLHEPTPTASTAATPQRSNVALTAIPSKDVQYVINGAGRLEPWTGTPEQAGLAVFSFVGMS